MKLSIIIPVYNEIRYLEKFTKKLTSAFNDQNVEYIFVNDGSNDGSAEWLRKYTINNLSMSNKNSFLLIDLKKNTGKGFALKKGLEVANGTHILFQDADLELEFNGTVDDVPVYTEANQTFTLTSGATLASNQTGVTLFQF